MIKILKYKFALVLLALSLVCYSLEAQQNSATPLTIQGTVYEATTGETLPGVSISIKGRMAGSTSDVNGKFSIVAYMGEWLVFSFMGFETYEFLIAGEQSNLKVSLTESSEQMEEVVVTGVGTQRRISTLAAVTSVDAKELQVPSPSISNLLGGRVAGLITMQASGEPGQNLAEFWVRGIGTFGANSSALVLIDGLEGDLNSIDPADVESFSILKDASATAVYGVRGANGVVLVTTKRGESGRLSITARVNYTISHIKRLPDYLRAYDYAVLTNEARAIRGEPLMYKDIELEIFRGGGLDPDFFPDIDWQDEIIRPISFRQTYYASGRGGGDVARYFVSLGGTNEGGAYKIEKGNYYTQNVGYNTYSFRLNLDINLSKTTVLKFNSDAYLSVNNRPGRPNTTNDIWRMQSSITPVLFPIKYSNGQLPAATAGEISPYVLLNHTGKSKITSYKAKFSMALEQDFSFITEGLKMRFLGSYDRNGGYTEVRAQMPGLYLAQNRNIWGQLVTREISPPETSEFYSMQNESTYRSFTFETAINYDRVFNSVHRIGGLAYLHLNDNMSTDQWTDSEMAGLGLTFAQIPKRYVRLTGRIGYGYADTYMIDLNFGLTGTENFMPGKQYGFFPSIALGWIPSNYDIVKDNLPWITLFKIRGSYGTVGNDRIGGSRFPYLSTVQSGSKTLWGGMSSVNTINIVKVGADNLEWEKAYKSNLGFDIQLFKNNASITIDVFHDKRDGIFQQRVQVPDYVGLISSPWGNTGGMVSWGTDGSASYTYDIKKDMSITVRGNYTFSKNKITNFESNYERYPYKDRINQPNNVVFGYHSLGFFKNQDDIDASPRQTWSTPMPGDLKYKDVNGDGVIDPEDQVPISYNQMFPLFSYGFGASFNYKSLSIGVLFRGTGKMDYYRNNTGYIPFNGNRLGNVLEQFKDPNSRWIPKWYIDENPGLFEGTGVIAENPNAKLPRLQWGNNSNNDQLSDFWKDNAQYLRLQEVTINYNLKNDFLKRIGIGSIDFQVVGNNLYVWDKVKIFDPEQANRLGAVYPIPTTYSFQLYINL
ncbi:MAG: TonB-dependent receptor [Bacteroidales bacterium]|jgi:TonB-linked SusC/RagA family outer membrane protein|nr:TonB-dependent receptor [Bacteroidales bacterium]